MAQSCYFDTLDIDVQRVNIGPGQAFKDTFFTNDELIQIRKNLFWVSEIEIKSSQMNGGV